MAVETRLLLPKDPKIVEPHSCLGRWGSVLEAGSR